MYRSKWAGLIATYAALGVVVTAFSVGDAADPVATRDLIGVVAGAGVMTMLVVELLKRLTSIRAKFQLRETEVWFEELLANPNTPSPQDFDPPIADDFTDELELEGSASRASRARVELESITQGFIRTQHDGPTSTGLRSVRRLVLGSGLRASMFGLPPGRLVAQLNIGVEWLRRLDTPSALAVYMALPLASRSSGRPRTSVDRWIHDIDPRSTSFDQRIALSLDALQTRLMSEWQFRVRLLAVVISGMVGVGLVAAPGLAPDSAWYAISCLVLGGPVAWTLRDLIAAVEWFRD